jgi:hypothetical protein
MTCSLTKSKISDADTAIVFHGHVTTKNYMGMYE